MVTQIPRGSSARSVRYTFRFTPRLETLEDRCQPSVNGLPYYDIGTPNVTDIWVNPTQGSDDATGASRDQAVRTFDEAWHRLPMDVAASGTGYRILLTAGDYAANTLPSWLADRTGSFENPIIIQPADGAHTARIHGYLDFFNDHYLYLIGLDFVTDPGYGGGGNVIHLASCTNVLLRDCNLDGFDGTIRQPQETLKVNQVQHIYVEDCDISGAFWFGLDYVAVQYGHVLNNKIHNTGDDLVVLKGGTAQILFEANEVYDGDVIGIAAGQGTGFEFMVSPWLHYEAYDLKIVNNIIHDVANAGLAVRGGYNILMANNTLYNVARGNNGPSPVLVAYGARSVDGDTATAQRYHNLGGWGPLSGEGGELIPNKNVYLFNNLIYNPTDNPTMTSQFTIFSPTSPPAGWNLPATIRADDNLQIRGNLIWNGPADLDLGVPDAALADEVARDNTINVLEPQLAGPGVGDFHPLTGGNVLGVASYTIPAFPGGDAPTMPAPPAGLLDNTVLRDRDGNTRGTDSPPGALYQPGVPPVFVVSYRLVNRVLSQSTLTGWQTIDTNVLSYAAAPDGTLYALRSHRQLRTWDGSSWTTSLANVMSFHIGTDGDVLALRANRSLWRNEGAGWSQIWTTVKSFRLAPNGTLFVLRTNNTLWSETASGRQRLAINVASITLAPSGTELIATMTNRRIRRFSAT